jgi:hypothetical protein
MKIKMQSNLVAFGSPRIAGEVIECDFNDRDTQYLLANHFATVEYTPSADADEFESADEEETADEEIADIFGGDNDTVAEVK